MFRRVLLALPLMLGALAFTAPIRAQQSSVTYTIFLPTVVGPAGVGLSAEEQAVLNEINQIRSLQAANVGESCPPLRVVPQLQAAARSHSADMAQRNFFNHINPDGVNPFERAQSAGYNGTQIAENIAAGYTTAADVTESWMNSSGHRANILDCSLTETGIGYVYQGDDQGGVLRANGTLGGPYFSYWTQVFGTP